MSEFTISEFHATPKMLFRQEIDAILEVVNYVLRGFQSCSSKGTLILDGQAKDHEARCIVRLNLADGAYWKDFFHIYERTSDDIAVDSINNALRWPEESRYKLIREKALHFGWLPSDIYRDEELEVLILNTTHGRFLASFCAKLGQTPHSDEETASVLVAIAAAIAKMGKEDVTLQHSATYIRERATDYEMDALRIVDKLFDVCALPCLRTWQEWHGPANSAEKRALFFE